MLSREKVRERYHTCAVASLKRRIASIWAEGLASPAFIVLNVKCVAPRFFHA